jgi:carboxypeptidase Taq
MDAEVKLTRLKMILNEYSDLANVAMLLNWDQQTYMPVGGTRGRGNQRATVLRLAHEKLTAPEVGQLLENLEPYAAGLDPDADEARLIKVTAREYEKNIKVPGDLVAEFAQVAAEAHPVWEKARKENDFPSFQPYLEKLVDLRRSYAALFAPYDHVYDPLLDDFEPGLKTADVQAIFSALRPQQVELIQAITESPQVDDSFLHQDYPEQKQWDFGVEVITRFGYDWDRGRQDKAAHPFTSSCSVPCTSAVTAYTNRASIRAWNAPP